MAFKVLNCCHERIYDTILVLCRLHNATKDTNFRAANKSILLKYASMCSEKFSDAYA